MILLEKLQAQGWYFTEEGLKKLTTINNSQTDDVNKIISLALDWDLKDIAAGALPSKPDSNGTISGRIVLQLQKMRNISAPKSYEESNAAPRFLQLELSDGVSTIAALEFERITSLNLNVPPGTKLFIKTGKLKLLNGFLMLKDSDIQILGGKVEALVEKWELARQMLKYAKSNRRLSGSGGPPPWIAFGKRFEAPKDAFPTDKNYKSLQAANDKDKHSKENDEFNSSRSQAIAEAARAGHKKVFGGGQQNILDHNVKKILEKGYSEEIAKQALKSTNNNLERAMYNLKRRNNVIRESSENKDKPQPQTNVSLFDFLTDKLPATISNTNTVQAEAFNNSTNNQRNSKDSNSTKSYNAKPNGNRFENNMSSSFAANRATITPRFEDRKAIQSHSSTFKQKQEDRIPQSVNNIEKGERNNTKRTKTQNPGNNKAQNQIAPAQDGILTLGSNKIERTEKLNKKQREQTHRQTMIDYQSNKRLTDNSSIIEKKSYQSKENNRNSQDLRSNTNDYHPKHTQKSNNFEKDLLCLVDSTSKLTVQDKKKISSNTQQSRGKNHHQTFGINKNQPTMPQHLHKSENYSNNSQQSTSQFADTSKSLQQKTKLAVSSPQLGNGFAYDPSKIVGFQSKEANEYAMNMLKSQGVNMQQLQQQQSISPQTQHSAAILPSSLQHPQSQILNNLSSATVAYITQNSNIFVAPPQQVPSQFGVMSGENWPWNEGDICLAKYWDDGNYYNAKITAVSEKTCVVLFMDYGNHEEVLKSDCIPITDGQHLPLNAYQTNLTTPPISQPPIPVHQQRPNISSGVGSGGVGNHRYRGDRQMYVPPPKRNNN